MPQSGHITDSATLHGQPLLGHSALLHLSVEKPVPAVVQRRPFKDEVLFRKSFRDVNNDSGTGRVFHSFPAGIVIHIVPEYALEQFPVDTWRTPAGILAAHAADQCANVL